MSKPVSVYSHLQMHKHLKSEIINVLTQLLLHYSLKHYRAEAGLKKAACLSKTVLFYDCEGLSL